MDGIGTLLKETRESSGVSINEASKDLDIKDLVLENIEAGKIGAFKDVLELKTLIQDYSKYLGLDSVKIIDEFNEYLFEYTSRIPVKELEKTIEMQIKEESDSNKIVSPYTKKDTRVDKKYYVAVILLVVALILIAMAWAISQVTVGSQTANTISYKG